ncbi:hypothetical protein [Halopseudomonas salegens]|uniref:Rod shape-determining protein MreB n=1 Tax=Halopseudomonas salegens TaxID=1434072 RepID=A0A1H2E7V5_9GAMM|nr:hypothetical protein [Halopseudomonas salegens]SDT91170.1 hypothetical protein SAMN05216210_0429 [Halopseudomonas salegens]
MRKALTVELYVKVATDTFRISLLSEPGREQSFRSTEVFTTRRLLVGEFSIAENCLKKAIASVVGKSLIPKSVAVVIHPEEMVDGGLSQVEERIYRELCYGAGARKVALWVGKDLSPSELRKLLDKV